MKKKTSLGNELSQEERQLMEALRRRPEMMARMQSILEIARNEGALRTADQVEELLVEEMRKLGNDTLRDWASGAQERTTQELRGQEPGLRSRKKNTEVVDGFRIGGSARVDLSHAAALLCASAA